MAVVVQRMVDARSSGVMFTQSPVNGDRSVVALDASWGLGSAVVGGEVTPDSYVINKITGDVVRKTIADKAVRDVPVPGGQGVRAEAVPEEMRTVAAVDDDEIHMLVEIGRRVEQHYGCPQDNRVGDLCQRAAGFCREYLPATESARDRGARS